METPYSHLFAFRDDSGATTRAYDFQYDSLGHLIRSKETNGGSLVQRTEHIYDNANRLTSQSWQIGNDSYTESYTYDATDGKLSSMTAANGAKITLTYDALKRLTTETTASGGSTLFTKSYAYRDSTSSDRTTLQVSVVNYKKGSTALAGYTYTYDKSGYIASEKDTKTGITTTYTYGTQGELLTAAQSSGKTYTYTYDTGGNILNAIQQGILTQSTKSRLEELEVRKEDWRSRSSMRSWQSPRSVPSL